MSELPAIMTDPLPETLMKLQIAHNKHIIRKKAKNGFSYGKWKKPGDTCTEGSQPDVDFEFRIPLTQEEPNPQLSSALIIKCFLGPADGRTCIFKRRGDDLRLIIKNEAKQILFADTLTQENDESEPLHTLAKRMDTWTTMAGIIERSIFY